MGNGKAFTPKRYCANVRDGPIFFYINDVFESEFHIFFPLWPLFFPTYDILVFLALITDTYHFFQYFMSCIPNNMFQTCVCNLETQLTKKWRSDVNILFNIQEYQYLEHFELQELYSFWSFLFVINNISIYPSLSKMLFSFVDLFIRGKKLLDLKYNK